MQHRKQIRLCDHLNTRTAIQQKHCFNIQSPGHISRREVGNKNKIKWTKSLIVYILQTRLYSHITHIAQLYVLFARQPLAEPVWRRERRSEDFFSTWSSPPAWTANCCLWLRASKDTRGQACFPWHARKFQEGPVSKNTPQGVKVKTLFIPAIYFRGSNETAWLNITVKQQ